jgi:hypothetical protein
VSDVMVLELEEAQVNDAYAVAAHLTFQQEEPPGESTE